MINISFIEELFLYLYGKYKKYFSSKKCFTTINKLLFSRFYLTSKTTQAKGIIKAKL